MNDNILKRIVRVGKIVDVNPEKCRARVYFPDNDIVTHELPIIQHHSHEDKFYTLPAVDEFVVCLFVPVGQETGFILGSYYSDSNPPVTQDKAKFTITFKDGTTLEYDKERHELSANVKGAAIITAEKDITADCLGSINVNTAENINITANEKVTVSCQNAAVSADKVEVVSGDILFGKGIGSGVVTQECFCSLTGGFHPDSSLTVKAVK